MNRAPPAAVRKQLRGEVGFGCPAPGCSNPYLYFHHFDPPWSEEQHHRPEGMIAFCAEHHAKADSGAYTLDQLRQMKAEAARSRADVHGRFDWLRRSLLLVVGSNVYPLARTAFRVNGVPIIWFTRDEEEHVLVNVDLSTVRSGEDRLVLSENDWLLRGTPSDFHCPPSGRLIHAKYPGGDELRVEFFDLNDHDALAGRYGETVALLGSDEHVAKWYPEAARILRVDSPITVVDVAVELPGTPFSFGRKATEVGGFRAESCVMFADCGFDWNGEV